MADARVLQSNPNTNYGSLSRLDVDSPGEESYIRFNVTGVTGTVQNAMLRLFVKSGSSDAPAIHATDNSWTETGITWNNRPAPTTSALANLGALSSSTWAEYDLTAHIAGDGVYSFVLIADSSDGIRFESREGNPAPELVLTFTSGPAPTATATALSTTVAPTATDTPAPAATATATPTETPVNTATPTATASPTPAAPTPTASPTPGSSSVTLAAAADARVLQSNPNTNYGTLSRLDVDSPGEESYIRFNVSGVTGAVQSATLRLFVSNASSNGPSIYATGNSWTETGLTWNNRPAPTSGVLANLGSAPGDTWAEYDLTAHISGNGTYSFVLLADSSDGIRFESREGSPAPELVLTFTSGPAPTPTATATSGPSPTPTATATASPTPTSGPSPTPTATPSSGSVIFVGAGDIADCSRVEDEMTAQLLDNIPGTVFTIGDNANPNGTAAQFNDCYEPTWGRHKARTHPAAGDNEYNSSSNAAAYFNYFGAAAGNPDEGWYSYNVGSWHIIVLNSNCSQVGGCEPDSPQGQWLQADLAANSSACTLAIHHEPLFSSKGGDDDLADFWEPLYEAGAEIVLSGHRHMYERFARQNPDGVADPERGIRQFVVGTGGNSLTSPPGGVAPNSEVRNNTAHGVLKFTLHPTSYDWEFIPIAGQTFTDSGSESCVIP